ncbi:MAG: hypothetical protein ACRBCT_05175 [Alphaproteobacteria bacterium]
MIENSAASPLNTGQKTLTFVKNERMGGTVPAWMPLQEGTKSAFETMLGNALTLETAQTQNTNALAYAPTIDTQNKEFTLGDLVDMVNPLHHVPILGTAYREITGDTIKPIGKIMGGAVYGGPLGAASGIIDIVVENETGATLESHITTRTFGREQNLPSAPINTDIKDLNFKENGGLYNFDA